MAQLTKIRALDCELSVRTGNCIRAAFGPDTTLAELAEVDVFPSLFTRRSIKELQEVITNARTWPDPGEADDVRTRAIEDAIHVIKGQESLYMAYAGQAHRPATQRKLFLRDADTLRGAWLAVSDLLKTPEGPK